MKISIITINYNNCEGLRKTIESVIAQSYANIEYIIIDGGSTDGSLDVLKKHDANIDKWVSEPDKGVYNAMNKGVDFASGGYCIFMNSGDVFYDNNVIAKVFSTSHSSYYICGNWHINGKLYTSPLDMTAYYLYCETLCHQAMFIKTDSLRKNPYDEKLKIVADWKHMFQSVILEDKSYEHVDVIVCKYDNTGFSTVNWEKLSEERERTKSEILPRLLYLDFHNRQMVGRQQHNNPALAEKISKIKPKSIDERFINASLKLLAFLRKIKHIIR